MFKLIAIVYLLVNGQPTGDDPIRFVNRSTFATIEECKGYNDTDQGEAEYNSLLNYLAKALPDGKAVSVSTACEKQEDNSI